MLPLCQSALSLINHLDERFIFSSLARENSTEVSRHVSFFCFLPIFLLNFVCMFVPALVLPLLFCELLQIIDMNVKNILEEPQLNR